MTKQLSKKIYSVISKTFEGMSKPQLKNFAILIVALFYNRTFAMREIASHFPDDSNVKHKLKRLIYFLDSLKITNDFWQSFVKTIFFLPYFKLGSRKYITIALDATTLRDDFWVLSASICYKKRAIPIYLKIWKGVNVSYNYWKRVREVLTTLQSILPKKYKYEIVADRGFSGSKMFSICHKIGWDYVIRINGCYKMQTKGGDTFIQLSLFDDGYYKDVILGKNDPTTPINVAINSITSEDKTQSKWFLATSKEDGKQAIDDYTRRFWIEESFKDLKTELKWEKYTGKIPQKERLEKTIIISCMSYAIRLCIGNKIQVPPSEEAKTSILKRVQHMLISSYRNIDKILTIIITFFSVNRYRLQYLF